MLRPKRPVEIDEIHELRPLSTKSSWTPEESRRLKKRVRVEKIRRDAEQNLRFLSTPLGQTENGLYYAYLSAPPESIVRVYMRVRV